MRKVFIGILVLAVLLIGGLPFVYGVMTEKVINQMAQGMVNDGLPITISDYQRGWFKSRADIELPPLTQEAATRWVQMQKMLGVPEANIEKNVHFVGTVLHGPIIFDRSRSSKPRFMFGQALIDLQLDEASSLFRQLTTYTNGSEPFHWLTLIKFNDEVEHLVSFAPAAFKNATTGVSANFEGARGKLTLSEDKQKFRFKTGALSASDASGFSLEVAPLTVEGHSNRLENTLWVGKARIMLPSAALLNIPGAGGTLKVDNVILQQSFNQTPGEANALDLTQTYQLALLTYEDQTYGPYQISFKLSRVDADALVTLRNAVKQFNQDRSDKGIKGPLSDAEKQLLLMSAVPNPVAFLRYGPDFEVDIQGKVNDDAFNFGVSLDLPEVQPDAQFNPLMLMQINAGVQGRFPLTLVKQSLGLVYLKSLESGKPLPNLSGFLGTPAPEAAATTPAVTLSLSEQAKARVETDLKQLADAGMIVIKDNDVTFDIRFNRGQLNINGKTQPLFGANGPFSSMQGQ